MLSFDREGRGSRLVDGTLGAGGHSLAFLRRYGELRVIGVDRDAAMQRVAKTSLNEFSDRVEYFLSWFDDFFEKKSLEGELFEGILFDLGISSLHYGSVGEMGRGFSFAQDQPLDMRLDETQPVSAASIINGSTGCGTAELADIFRLYAEERYAKEIAEAIVSRREESPFLTSLDLAAVIERAVPFSARMKRIHPATKSFQALRIVVNGELDRLERVLQFAFESLAIGGRMGVISFHSLEDRIVKQRFKEFSLKRGAKLLTTRPVSPSEEEVEKNPASRSAKLRVIERV